MVASVYWKRACVLVQYTCSCGIGGMPIYDTCVDRGKIGSISDQFGTSSVQFRSNTVPFSKRKTNGRISTYPDTAITIDYRCLNFHLIFVQTL